VGKGCFRLKTEENRNASVGPRQIYPVGGGALRIRQPWQLFVSGRIGGVIRTEVAVGVQRSRVILVSELKRNLSQRYRPFFRNPNNARYVPRRTGKSAALRNF
jgi:hypothetical protein